MATARDKTGRTDSIAMTLNDEPLGDYPAEDLDQSHVDGCKGPDPDQWDDHGARVEDEFVPGSEHEVRHDDVKYDDGGKVISFEEVTHVKGPGPEWTTTPG